MFYLDVPVYPRESKLCFIIKLFYVGRCTSHIAHKFYVSGGILRSMRSKSAWMSLLVLTIVVAVLAAILIALPAPLSNGNPTPSPPTGETQPFTSENVNIDSPLPGATVGRSFAVTGAARGPWYFEASFPVQVRGPNDEILASTYAQAQGEWMTTEFVPFTSTVTISGSYTGPAELLLLKDNPSGLPENDDSISIPIVIK